MQYAQYAPFGHHALLPLQVNILDKSKMDWNQLKSADANMEEELEAHKRSNKKYLDKVSVVLYLQYACKRTGLQFHSSMCTAGVPLENCCSIAISHSQE